MAIRLDPLLVRTLAAELRQRLGGARVRAVLFDHVNRESRLYTDGGLLVFRVGSGGRAPSIAVLGATEPPEEARRLPVRVDAVRAVADERIIALRMVRIRGRRASYGLFLELRPNEANAALTEGERDTIRHVLATRAARGRNWQVGHPYPLPHADRMGASGTISPDEWRDLLERVSAEDRSKVLLRSVAFVSPLNVDWIVDPERRSDAQRQSDGDWLTESHTRWRELVEGAHERAWLIHADGEPQPYPHLLGRSDRGEAASVLAALADDEGDDSGSAPRALMERLRRLISSSEKRVATLERRATEAEAEDPGRLRSKGDLLLAKLHEVRRGEPGVELEDFEGSTVRIELDPTLAPQENAARYYTMAAKMEKARRRLPGLIAQARKDLDGWHRLLEEVEADSLGPADLAARLPDPRSVRTERDAPSLPYKTYKSSGGLEIRVGKNGRKNDELTFGNAHPDDVWLHARHASGAHVVLRWTRPEAPPSRDLNEAAILAALHSKARSSGSVPVDWTRRKHVRKPRGARPGTVVLARQQTVFVEPDPEVAARLEESPAETRRS